jgi:hypothetical protein
MGLKLAMGALPRAILTFQLRLRSGFLGVPIYCGAQALVFTSVSFGAAFFLGDFFLGVTHCLPSFLLIASFIGATYLPTVLSDFV